jgi:hypothetical protein
MLDNTWTVIRVGINANNRHISSFHIRAELSPLEAKAHALAKINGDWANHRTEYLLDCISRGDFTVSHTTGA